MASSIPQRIVTQRAAPRGESYRGEFPVGVLRRLADAVAGPAGTLAVDVQLSRDPQGHDRVQGHIRGGVTLQCQRCLQPFLQSVDLPLRLRLVYDEREEQAALAHDEPYLVPEQGLSLRELIEDEVLLALPMAPRCGDPACTAAMPAAAE